MSSALTQALPVSMAGFKSLLTSVSPDMSICVRGRHAVGKSEGVYQAAADMRAEEYKDPEFCARMVERFEGGTVRHATGIKSTWTYEDGIPVVERRLSQMTEGDTIGLPHDSGHGTVFKACDWLYTSSDFPVVLFLDERNRALDGVKQSVFQLCDSKTFYGRRLHPETRVLIAENVGDEYQVQACDPAEVSRTAVIILDPDEKEWLEYASGKCDQATIEFIRSNANKLEHKGTFEPNKKYQDRRSWFKFDAEAQRLGLFDKPEDPLFYILACSMLGMEVGGQFVKFCKERDRQVSAADILSNWANARKRLSKQGTVSNESFIECTAKLGDYLKDYKLSEEEAHQLALFMFDGPAEIFLTAWSACSSGGDNDNVVAMHPYVMQMLVAVATGKPTAGIVCPSVAEVKASRAKPVVGGGRIGKRGAKSKASKAEAEAKAAK